MKKKRLIKAWIKALRGKEYNRCENLLHTGNCFCALGVLLDVFIKNNETPFTWQRIAGSFSDTYVFTDGKGIYTTDVIFDEILEEMGLRNLSLHYFRTVSHLNDNHFLFDKIANYVEERILPDA